MDSCDHRKIIHLHPTAERETCFDEQIALRTLHLSEANAELRQENEKLRQELDELTREIESVRKSEYHYRMLTENVTDVVWRLDRDYRFTYISPSDERIRGYRAEEVIGTSVFELFNEEGRAAVRRIAAERQEAEERGEPALGPTTFEALHRCKDGQLVWAEICSTPDYDADGRIVGFYGISREISKRKRTEELLKEAKSAAEKANKVKSEFLALVSHEIRTPLSSLVGFSKLARTTADPAKLDQYHAILEASSHSLMLLVNDILDMSKIEAGRMTFESVPYDLRQLVAGLGKQYRQAAHQKMLTFTLNDAAMPPTWVIGDPTRLRQILDNLLANAVKFTEQGGITCTVRPVERSAAGAHSLVRFEVCDTGIGIPRERQSHLYQPFRQLDPSISRTYGGTGLGLAIVHSLVGMMGGSISLESREGEGSCFVVELPLRETQPQPEAELPYLVSCELGLVLIVEDNLFNRQLLEEILVSWGQKVALAENGREALVFLEHFRFDLILLDIRMPGIDGIEVARRIRLLEQERSAVPVPIIALTADIDRVTREACLAVGINEVLGKPVNPEQLARVLALHCEGKVTISAAEQRQLNEQVRRGMGNDPDRVRQYWKLLAQDIADELSSSRSALDREDRAQLELSTHTLKGLCGQLADRKAVELAGRLHRNAPSAPSDQVGQIIEELQTLCRLILISAG